MMSLTTIKASVVLVVGLLVVPTTHAAAPIPASLDAVGWTLSDGSASSSSPTAVKNLVEVFVDFSCDDSANAWHTVVKPLAASNVARVVLHAFPLTYHHNSFDAAQTARVIVDSLATKNPTNDDDDDETALQQQAATATFDAMFGNQTRWMSWQTPNPTANMTQAEVISDIFADVAEGLGVPRDVFLGAIGVGWNSTPTGPFAPTRDAWKWAAARGISGTPTFAANGVFSDDLNAWTLDNWTQWADPYSASSGVFLLPSEASSL